LWTFNSVHDAVPYMRKNWQMGSLQGSGILTFGASRRSQRSAS